MKLSTPSCRPLISSDGQEKTETKMKTMMMMNTFENLREELTCKVVLVTMGCFSTHSIWFVWTQGYFTHSIDLAFGMDEIRDLHEKTRDCDVNENNEDDDAILNVEPIGENELMILYVRAGYLACSAIHVQVPDIKRCELPDLMKSDISLQSNSGGDYFSQPLMCRVKHHHRKISDACELSLRLGWYDKEEAKNKCIDWTRGKQGCYDALLVVWSRGHTGLQSYACTGEILSRTPLPMNHGSLLHASLGSHALLRVGPYVWVHVNDGGCGDSIVIYVYCLNGEFSLMRTRNLQIVGFARLG